MADIQKNSKILDNRLLFQSPIDIDSKITLKIDKYDEPFEINYHPVKECKLQNNGYTWQLKYPENDMSFITGGPMGDNRFKLQQIHCHWGTSVAHGSEHTVNGLPYSGELHLVHWNMTKYKSYQEAYRPDGIVVVALFLQINSNLMELDKITKLLQLITYKNDILTMPFAFDARNLLPTNKKSFWTYHGSLTTPHFDEIVNWVILKESIEVSEKQLDAMRHLKSCTFDEQIDGEENREIRQNLRGIMPLGERKLNEYQD